MAIPEDAGDVVTAMRLGWNLAEVRGRNRPDAPPGAKAGLPGPPSHALPLHIEQSQAELRIQAQGVVATMAKKLGVDLDKDGNSFSSAIAGQAKMLAAARESAGAAPAGPAGSAVLVSARGGTAAASGGPPAGSPVLADGRESTAAAPAGPAPSPLPAATGNDPLASNVIASDPPAQWNVLEELIFKFDAHIQDTMASGPDTVACGYQLGRALAEPYWALDPTLGKTSKSPMSWWFLLGAERCSEICRLVGRLTAYFHPYTAAAVAGSVQVWKHVAADQNWRENADDALYRQIRRWYELVIMQQDPTTLVKPYALIRNFRMVKRALRIFWPELSGAIIAAAALSLFAGAIGQNNISSLAKSAFGFIAITGFSIAGLTARFKNQAQAMVLRLRQDVYTDLVAVAITTAPLPPAPPSKKGILAAPQNAIAASKQKRAMTRIVRERSLTPVTPN
jgi:hypothetical protein